MFATVVCRVDAGYNSAYGGRCLMCSVDVGYNSAWSGCGLRLCAGWMLAAAVYGTDVGYGNVPIVVCRVGVLYNRV